MKHIKTTVSLLLVLVMIMGMTTTAFAATVTLPTEGILAGHSFKAYQVFSGDYSGGVLSNVDWGDGIDRVAFLAALKADTTYGNLFTNCDNAAQVADVLSSNNTNTGLANQVAKLAEKHKTGTGTQLVNGSNTLSDGYYLIVDTTANVAPGSAYNAALLQVVGDITINVKTDAPSVEKKVLEDDKPTPQDANYGTGYNDVADYDMGEAVPFHLIGLVPDMSRYDHYKYVFHDTLSAGLTPPAVSGVKVYLSADKKVDAGVDTDVTANFTVDVTGQKITVSSNDIKVINGIAQGMYLIVEYSAVLNQSAVVGLPGNPNTVYLEYSNKPDQSGSGSGQPGDENETGNTPEDKVIVFTYELDVTKVDGQNAETKLENAKFVLLNKMKDKVAKVTAEGKLDGWVDLPGENQTWDPSSVLTSDVNGLFKVIGLDDDTYYLREIEAPTGYNLLANDVEVKITATTANGQDWTDGNPATALTNLAVTADTTPGTGNVETGIAAITIANNAGSTLPETGGIGTTIFYVLGSTLVVAAIVFLVTRRRMSSVEK